MLKTALKFENYGSSGVHYIGYGVDFEVPGGTIGSAGISVNVPAEHAIVITAAVKAKRPAMVVTSVATFDDGVLPEYMPFQKDNYGATTTPDADNDETEGYSVGSVWINTTATPHEVYRCVDATEGAAVWLNTSLEISEVHTQGTDQGLDTGGPNAVTVAAVKGAITNSHAPGSDNQSLSGLATKVPVDPVPTGKVAVFDETGNIAVATPGLHVADGTAVSGTATTSGYGFVSAEEMNTFLGNVNGIKDAVNSVIARLEGHGLIAAS
jgi:hypothetical protein